MQVITAPAGSGGFDSSILLNVGEQLRDENRYDRCCQNHVLQLRHHPSSVDTSADEQLVPREQRTCAARQNSTWHVICTPFHEAHSSSA